VITREGFIADGPAVIGRTSGRLLWRFGAAGAQVVAQQTIAHPTHPFRMFLQSIDWAPESTPKRRSVR
jgi:hypothetical protein